MMLEQDLPRQIPMLARATKALHAFSRSRRGNVAITFALATIPMIGLVGLGIDVSRTLAAKSTLDAAADAAALAAATQAETQMQSVTGRLLGTSAAMSAGQTAGQNLFGIDASKVGTWIGGTPTPTVTVSMANQVITATVTYQADVPTAFGPMVRVKSMHLAGTAVSSLTMPKYLNISVAVDISQSMGLAATSTDMSNLQSLTGGCAFGCHVLSPNQVGTIPYEQLAHQNNITLRIDVIRQATQNMIQTAQNLQSGTAMISFGLYTIQGGTPQAPGLPFSVLAAPSTNYSALVSAANGIDLGPNVSAGIGDTNFTAAMPSLSAVVPISGDGSTALTAQQFVFLMTDGVQDIYGPGYGNHATQAFDPTQCAALKAKGVTVGVIYTTYLAMPTRPEYLALVSPFANQIAPNLQACASSGWYYQASDGTDIQTAINALFAKATGAGVLTQ